MHETREDNFEKTENTENAETSLQLAFQDLLARLKNFVKRATTCEPTRYSNPNIIFTEHYTRYKRHGDEENSDCKFDDRIIGTITILALAIFGISVCCCERMRKKTVDDMNVRRKSIQDENNKVNKAKKKGSKKEKDNGYNPGAGGFHAVKFDV